MYTKLEKYAKVNKIKLFSVSDGDDDEVFENVKKYYKKYSGKDLDGRSMPNKNKNGFYECSMSKTGVQYDPGEFKKPFLL